MAIRVMACGRDIAPDLGHHFERHRLIALVIEEPGRAAFVLLRTTPSKAMTAPSSGVSTRFRTAATSIGSRVKAK